MEGIERALVMLGGVVVLLALGALIGAVIAIH